MPGLAAIAAIGLLAACASPARFPTNEARERGQPLRSSEIRSTALFVSVELGAGTFTERERAALPANYEGALVEALNGRAVLAPDARLLGVRERIDFSRAAMRAREVGADHAIIVVTYLTRGERVFCGDTRRPFRASATQWSQTADVIRANDGARRLTIAHPGIEVSDLEPDCDDPRASRRRAMVDTMTDAIERLLKRLLG